MKDPKTYIESGMLELFVLGMLDPEEALEISQAAAMHSEIRAELDAIQNTTEGIAKMAAITPPDGSKEKFLTSFEAVIAEERAAARPPILNPKSTKVEFETWLSHPDHQEPEDYDNLHFIPVVQNEDGATIIVWIKDRLPEEVHHDSIEKFLVIEGACDISFKGKTFSIGVGDYLSIPLHTPHTVTITSDVACKLIVQRIAA